MGLSAERAGRWATFTGAAQLAAQSEQGKGGTTLAAWRRHDLRGGGGGAAGGAVKTIKNRRRLPLRL
jgi:hypothetical protein